jgi:hypothetical protein
MAKVNSNGTFGSGRKITGVRVSSAQSREHNLVSAEFLLAQRNADPAFRAWEQLVKSRSLGPTKTHELRKKFGQHVSRDAETNALLATIADKLSK